MEAPRTLPAAADRRPRKRATIVPGAVLDGLVRDALAETAVPLSAYDIAHCLRRQDGPSNMMSIYRSLNRLCERQVVERVETVSAYRLRDVPGAILMTCTQCRATTPVAANQEESRLRSTIADTGFLLSKLVLEATGICGRCRNE